MPVKNNNKSARGANKRAGNVADKTPEQKRTLLAKQLNLKPKTKLVVDEILENKGISHTEAYMRHHSNSTRDSARASVSKLLAKENVQIYKDSAIRKAKSRVVSLVDSGNEGIALKASQDILDRTEGKAAQKIEQTTRTVEVKLDLTGVKLGNHYLNPTQVAEA